MKKFLVSTLAILSLVGVTSSASAGGGMMYTYDNADLSLVIESIQDKDLKDLIAKHALTASQNNLTEDWDFNNKNYYTKKITLNASIPEAIKSKVSSAYISLWISQPNMMPMMDVKMSDGTNLESSNEYKITLNKDTLEKEVKVTRSDLDKYITDQYGASFNGKLVLELTDGTKLPYSNMFYLYMSKDNVDGKIAHISNLYYVNNPNNGWANTQELLKKVFERLQKKYPKAYDYITVLEKVAKKIDTISATIKSEQTKIAESIRSEEDFPKHLENGTKLMEKMNILNDIRYQISSEIKTRQSEGIIDEIFSEDKK